MRLLALETAAAAAQVALLEGESVRARAQAAAGEPAAEVLLGLVERVLADAGVGLETLEAWAVSIGPGSFTGLRVGLASLKGLAFGSERPVAPVPTLAALAWEARTPEAAAVVASLDARRGELYAGAWVPGPEGWSASLPEAVVRPAALAEALLAGAAGPLVLAGEGSDALARALAAQGAADRVRRAATGPGPSAEAVAALGLRILARGGGQRAESLVPRYLRRAEAEVVRTGERVDPSPDPAGRLL